MKNKLFFSIILITMLLASIYLASAITCSGTFPQTPQVFYGNITYTNGTPLSFSDNNVTPVLEDNSFSTITDSNGGYGGLSVEKCSATGSTAITFYVQGQSISTFTFSAGAETKLDLNLSGKTYCGDGTCNGNETQESDNTYPNCNRDCGARVNSYSINSSVSSTSATIAWTTNKLANSTVSYGTTTALGSTGKSSDYVTSHSVSLSSLSASTTYYYNITSCDTINNSVGCVTNGTNTFTTSAAASTTTSTGSGGSSSGGTSTETTTPETQAVTESKTIAVITAGTTETVVFTKSEQLAVTEINIETKNTVSSVTVTSTESSKPASAPLPVESSSGSVYKYLEIKVENIKTGDINRAFISFSVPKTWISANSLDPNTVALNRLSGSVWTKLATAKTSEDSSTYYFKAETPGFSTFAITAQKKVETPADMAGLKIRVPNNIMQIKAIELMGATPTPMPLCDVYPALTQGKELYCVHG